MYKKEILVESTARNQMINVTRQVELVVKQSGIENGIVTLFVPHTTAAITINENADPDVKTDMMNGLSMLLPKNDNYRHYEGNSDAHIKSSLVGVDQTVILTSGKLVLGTWQGLYFCDFDGPRRRKLFVFVKN